MAFTWRTSKTGTVQSTAIVVTEPTGIASGDWEFVLISVYAATVTVATPAGWTLFADSGAGTTTRYYIFYVTGGRGASAPGLTFTASAGVNFHEWHCLAVAGSNLTIDASGTQALVNGTNPNPPLVSAGQTTDESIAIGFNFAGATWTAPAGYTIRSINTGGLDCVAASKDLSSSGNEDPAVFTGPLAADDIYAATILLQITGAATLPVGDASIKHNPVVSKYTVDARSAISQFELSLIGKDKFFAAPGIGPQYDYPNPRGKPFPIEGLSVVDPMEHWLLKDKFFAAAGMGPQYDYPNPKGKPFPIEGLTFFDPTNKLLIGKDKFFAAPGMGPEYDWANPRAPIYPSDLRTLTNNLLQSTLGIVTQSPFAIVDWPNPAIPRFPIDNRTFLDKVDIQLIGLDQFFGAPGMGPDYDWPNPQIARQPDRTTWIQNLLDTTLATPFNSWVWTLPTPPPRLSTLHFHPGSVQTQLKDQFFGIAGQPPANLDWPNPRGATPPIGLRSWLESLKIALLGQDQMFGAAGQPASPMDWPNPRIAVVPRFSILESLKINLLVPFSATDWANPLKYPYSRIADVPINLLNSILAVISQQPFSLIDWPNPTGSRFPIELRTFLDAVDIQLTGLDQFFGAPGQPLIHEWVNPRGPVPSIDLRSWANDLIHTTLAIILPYPFSLIDWPNPRGPLFPIEMRTFLDPVDIQLIGRDQFFGSAGMGPTYSWPNPRGAQYPSDLRTFIASLQQQFGRDQFFAAQGMGPQYSWPNPLIKPYPIDTRSWLNDLVSSTLAPPPYPFSLIDWPNPRIAPPLHRGAVRPIDIQLIGKDKFFGGPGQPPEYQPPNNPLIAGRAADLRTWLINLQQTTLNPFSQPPFYLLDWPNPQNPQTRARWFKIPASYTWSSLRPGFGPSVSYPSNRSRRITIVAAGRVMLVDQRKRTMIVAANIRTVVVKSDARTMVIPPYDREDVQ